MSMGCGLFQECRRPYKPGRQPYSHECAAKRTLLKHNFDHFLFNLISKFVPLAVLPVCLWGSTSSPIAPPSQPLASRWRIKYLGRKCPAVAAALWSPDLNIEKPLKIIVKINLLIELCTFEVVVLSGQGLDRHLVGKHDGAAQLRHLQTQDGTGVGERVRARIWSWPNLLLHRSGPQWKQEGALSKSPKEEEDVTFNMFVTTSTRAHSPKIPTPAHPPTPPYPLPGTPPPDFVLRGPNLTHH